MLFPEIKLSPIKNSGCHPCSVAWQLRCCLALFFDGEGAVVTPSDGEGAVVTPSDGEGAVVTPVPTAGW